MGVAHAHAHESLPIPPFARRPVHLGLPQEKNQCVSCFCHVQTCQYVHVACSDEISRLKRLQREAFAQLQDLSAAVEALGPKEDNGDDTVIPHEGAGVAPRPRHVSRCACMTRWAQGACMCVRTYMCLCMHAQARVSFTMHVYVPPCVLTP